MSDNYVYDVDRFIPDDEFNNTSVWSEQVNNSSLFPVNGCYFDKIMVGSNYYNVKLTEINDISTLSTKQITQRAAMHACVDMFNLHNPDTEQLF